MWNCTAEPESVSSWLLHIQVEYYKIETYLDQYWPVNLDPADHDYCRFLICFICWINHWYLEQHVYLNIMICKR